MVITTMSRPLTWRVRVKRLTDEWVQVEADDPIDAEREAYKVPRVQSVIGGSAIRADFTPPEARPLGVMDE
jgi:hypothetical protein